MSDSTGIIVLSKDGDLLLVQRDQDAPSAPDTWNIVGGHREGEESPVETAVREVKEETGMQYKTEDLKFFRNYAQKVEGGLHTVSVFISKYVHPQKLIIGEGKGIGFFSKEEIAHLRVTPITKQIITDFFNYDGS